MKIEGKKIKIKKKSLKLLMSSYIMIDSNNINNVVLRKYFIEMIPTTLITAIIIAQRNHTHYIMQQTSSYIGVHVKCSRYFFSFLFNLVLDYLISLQLIIYNLIF